MAQESNLREKIGTTLITIILTALGTVAFQSAKYMFFDFHDKFNLASAQFDEKTAKRLEALDYENEYKKARNEIIERSLKCHKLLNSFETLNAPRRKDLKEREVLNLLGSAYSDLGTISYTPVLGKAMETEREAYILDLKSQIEGLEILENLFQIGGDEKAQTKLAGDLVHNSMHRSQTLSGLQAVSKTTEFAAAAEKREWDVTVKRYRNETDDIFRWGRVADVSFTASLIGYLCLLTYLTFQRKAKPEVKEAASSAAKAT